MKYFCFHNWTKWGDVIQDHSGDRNQFRKCTKCNKFVKRKSFWANSITDIQIMKSIKGNNV